MDFHEARGRRAKAESDLRPHRGEEHARDDRATAGWLESNLPLSLDAYEKAALERALVVSWGDAAEAARVLGIGRSTFYRKAGKHGIHLGGPRAASPAPKMSATSASGVGPAKTLG